MQKYQRFFDLVGACLALVVILASAGCVNVKPWEKAAFSKDHMAFDPDPLEAKLVRHMQESKEAAAGGYGVSVVGCGCN